MLDVDGASTVDKDAENNLINYNFIMFFPDVKNIISITRSFMKIISSTDFNYNISQ